MSFRIPIAACAALLAFLAANPSRAEEPLHQAIDAAIEAAMKGEASPIASDAEFVRRAYLDFAGRIPTAKECRRFLADQDESKRAKLVDELIARDTYAPRMANAFHIMLMERRGEEPEWMRFLIESFRVNKPWDRMSREIVSPNPDDELTRGAAFFYTKRLEKYGQNPVDYPGLVRDVGRMFMGVDVQCAQCHDHLFVDDYKQVDYQGLFAFVGGSTIRRDTKFPAVAEKPLAAKIEFQSVFDTEQMTTGPRLPFGKEVEFPVFKKGEEYETPPDRKKKTPGVLKFSPLKKLGEELPTADNRLFALNIANRLWWLMMGRGLVEPLDLHHSDNPASHPKLLERIADEVVQSGFDIKHVLREIALSNAYQRSTRLPPDGAEPKLESYRTAIERPLSAKQVLDSVRVAIEPVKEADATEAETAEYDERLKRFRAALAAPPREPETEVNPTVKAALFFMHDAKFNELLKPREGNLIGRLIKTKDDAQAAELLFIAILSRPPEQEEAELVQHHLKAMGERRGEAFTQLAWSLLASTEFVVNH